MIFNLIPIIEIILNDFRQKIIICKGCLGVELDNNFSLIMVTKKFEVQFAGSHNQ